MEREREIECFEQPVPRILHVLPVLYQLKGLVPPPAPPLTGTLPRPPEYPVSDLIAPASVQRGQSICP